MRLSLRWPLLVIIVALLASCTSVPDGVKPVQGFELQRYLGQWYELARYDHSFEEGLTQVTATYSMRDDGGVKVVNKGYASDTGKWEEAEGTAYLVDEATTAHLKVSFFGPFYASYVVMKLDKANYQYALVTGPDRDYLWLLARTKTLPDNVLAELMSFAENAGYDTEKLIWVDQNSQ